MVGTGDERNSGYKGLLAPLVPEEYFKKYMNFAEDSKLLKLRVKEYSPQQHIQEWVCNVTPLIK